MFVVAWVWDGVFAAWVRGGCVQLRGFRAAVLCAWVLRGGASRRLGLKKKQNPFWVFPVLRPLGFRKNFFGIFGVALPVNMAYANLSMWRLESLA